MNPIIELDSLSVDLAGRPILKGLELALSGRSIGLLGPNGAGKTTLIHTLLGFHAAKTGTARVFGLDIRRETRKLRSLVGYMPEKDSFIAGMNAVRFVRLMAELSGLPPRAALERTHEALHYVGLGEARYRVLKSYSQGMKQRVKLAQALVHGPRLLFLDEPTNGLDPPSRQRMIELIHEIKETEGIHIVLSSHLLGDVEETCDEVLVLRDGELATYCNLEEERRSNKRFIELETRGSNGAFLDALNTLGCECAVLKGGKLKTVLPEGVEVRKLFEIAGQQQVQIRRLDFKRDSLQDIFLKAMGDHNGSL